MQRCWKPGRFPTVIAEAIRMAVAEKRKEAEILSMVPVRIPDFDIASGYRPPVERLPAEPFETRRERPPVERLPEELPEAPREERREGRRPQAERLPEDILQKRARPEAGESWDIVAEEAKPAEEPKKKGKKGEEFNPFE
ncbi:MAG: hypothetical protein AB1657_02695 [Candidatus Micrarchaeota archaeon]